MKLGAADSGHGAAVAIAAVASMFALAGCQRDEPARTAAREEPAKTTERTALGASRPAVPAEHPIRDASAPFDPWGPESDVMSIVIRPGREETLSLPGGHVHIPADAFRAGTEVRLSTTPIAASDYPASKFPWDVPVSRMLTIGVSESVVAADLNYYVHLDIVGVPNIDELAITLARFRIEGGSLSHTYGDLDWHGTTLALMPIAGEPGVYGFGQMHIPRRFSVVATVPEELLEKLKQPRGQRD